MSHAHRALVALVLVAGVAGHASQANADAIADQNEVYKEVALSQADAKCTIFTKSDAERVFHAPVMHIESEVEKNGCTYGLATDKWINVAVWRSKPPLDPPSSGALFGVKPNSQIRHVKGVGQDAYTYYVNMGYGGKYCADVLTSKGVTRVVLAEKAGNADTTLAIARMVMNR